MFKFVIKNIEAVKGKQKFRQLVIVGDNVNTNELQARIGARERDEKEVVIKGVLDNYEDNLESKYKSSFRGIVAIMNRVANLQPVPETKFKDVTPNGELVKEYEFKFQDLRVWAIKISDGKLVLLGGYKNQQKKDFKTFRNLKIKYLESINKK
jgi:hypothetical protein